MAIEAGFEWAFGAPNVFFVVYGGVVDDAFSEVFLAEWAVLRISAVTLFLWMSGLWIREAFFVVAGDNGIHVRGTGVTDFDCFSV